MLFRSLREICFDFGSIFSELSPLEIFKSCIPPMFIIGIKVIAITIIPIPPNHWSIALQLKIALGVSDKLLIIVAACFLIILIWAFRYPGSVEEYDKRIKEGKKIGWLN